MLYTLMQESFTKAVSNEENWTDGKINWNFVDSDVYMDVSPKLKMVPSEKYMEVFDALADKFLVDVPVQSC
jgi:hypothetical protein